MADVATKWYIDDVAPTDAEWITADDRTKLELWRAVVAFGLKYKDQELASGLDVRGRKLTPISPRTRRYRVSAMGPADPNAPPLTPAYGMSRTRLNLEGRVVRRHGGFAAEFYWTDGWGKILAIHAAGSRRKRLPKRDVIGLSPKYRKLVQQAVDGWWAKKKSRQPMPPSKLVIPERTGPLPREGRSDYERFTYGIGSIGQTKEREVRRGHQAFREGRATGFVQLRPGTGPPGIGGPTGPRGGRPFEPEPPLHENPFWVGPKPKVIPAPAAMPTTRRAEPPAARKPTAPAVRKPAEHTEKRILPRETPPKATPLTVMLPSLVVPPIPPLPTPPAAPGPLKWVGKAVGWIKRLFGRAP